MNFGAVLFDLLVNGAVSLLFALAIARALAFALKLPGSRARALLLLAPLAKAAWEVARGIPEGAFFWARHEGALRQVGTLRAGVGVAFPAVPVFHLALGARTADRVYDESVGDGVAALLAREVSPAVPALVGWGLFGLVVVRLAVFAWREGRAWSDRRRALAGAALACERAVLRGRRVRVLVASSLDGTPFAGGLLRPYVCFPQSTFDALTEEEREAVLAHELAHLRSFDQVTLFSASVLGAAFGWVPGAAGLVRSAREECELAADAAAARAGSGAWLASALVTVAQRARAAAEGEASALALVAPRSLVARRVRALLQAPAPAPPRWLSVVRVALACGAILSLLRATTFGNP